MPTVAAAYAALVEGGSLDPDPAQAAAVVALDALAATLEAPRPARGLLARLAGAPRPAAPRGLYVWGAVGRGKTFLMDLFHEHLGVERKRRAHFHAFMGDVHERVARLREAARRGEAPAGDPLVHVADALAREARVLCFDEFAVGDIADAMILGRLFTALFARGVTVVATSNVEPSRLYEGGLNRARFLPFVALLQERCAVLELRARTDYRLEKLAGAPVYHVPADAAAGRALDAAFARLAAGAPARPAEVLVRGRRVRVPLAAGGVARFSFADLCGAPLGAADYIALARAHHAFVLDGVPVLGAERRNEAKRFITLIDVLYEHRVKLVMSAGARPEGLYVAEEGREAFEFARTVSRLHEMASGDYLALPHGREAAASADLGGLVET